MSNSEDNLDRQKRRHKGPLIGYIFIAIVVMAAGLWWLFGNEPGVLEMNERPEGESPALAPAEPQVEAPNED